MKLRLHESVASPQDLQALISELRDYSRWFGANAIKKQVHSRHPASNQPELAPATKAVLHDWVLKNPISRASIDELITQLEHYVNNARVMTIVLAAPPTGGIKKQLTLWCREHISPNILVRFEFNQNLLGGMVVRYGSRIYDWSFRRQILENRTKITEALKNV